jgi:putative endonuclease
MNPTNSYFVYAILLSNNKIYIGQTNNLERRLLEHTRRRSPYTRKYHVEKLLYSKTCPSRSDALKYEKYLKSGQGRQFLRSILAEQSAKGG